MERIQLFIQHDAAKETIEELGELGAIQFIDV
jgi:vacuolar-type H+-ATPase subunit I/STV1